jgi:hypothetical protein
MYLNFRNKYESALELIQTISEEKEKLNTMIKLSNNKKNHNISYFESLDSPYNPNKSEIANVSVTEPSEFCLTTTNNYNNCHNYINHNTSALTQYDNSHYVQKIDGIKNDFNKLKEDYYTLFEEKKSLEVQLCDFLITRSKLEELSEKYNTIAIQNDSNSEKIIKLTEQNKSLQERLFKLGKENFDLVKLVNNVKESLNSSEKERNNAKNKISLNISKIKTFEKEIQANKKKSQTLNFQIKNLTSKLKTEQLEKILLEKKNEDLTQELERKSEVAELEKQKLMKESLINFIKEIACNKNSGVPSPIELTFDGESNSISIFYEKQKIAEMKNSKEFMSKNENLISSSTACFSNHSEENPIMKSENEGRRSLSGRKKLDENMNPSIPNLEQSQKKIIANRGGFNPTSPLIIGKFTNPNGISLKKLFSKSSCKSLKSNYSIESLEDKENSSYFSNQKSRILLENISSSRSKTNKNRTEMSKLEVVEEVCNFQANTSDFTNNIELGRSSVKPENIENCILQTNLNQNVRYYLTSNNINRHKKVLSYDEKSNKREEIFEQKKTLFYEKINHICFEIKNEKLNSNTGVNSMNNSLLLEVSKFNFSLCDKSMVLIEENIITPLNKDKNSCLNKEEVYLYIEDPRSYNIEKVNSNIKNDPFQHYQQHYE